MQRASPGWTWRSISGGTSEAVVAASDSLFRPFALLRSIERDRVWISWLPVSALAVVPDVPSLIPPKKILVRWFVNSVGAWSR